MYNQKNGFKPSCFYSHSWLQGWASKNEKRKLLNCCLFALDSQLCKRPLCISFHKRLGNISKLSSSNSTTNKNFSHHYSEVHTPQPATTCILSTTKSQRRQRYTYMFLLTGNFLFLYTEDLKRSLYCNFPSRKFWDLCLGVLPSHFSPVWGLGILLILPCHRRGFGDF